MLGSRIQRVAVGRSAASKFIFSCSFKISSRFLDLAIWPIDKR